MFVSKNIVNHVLNANDTVPVSTIPANNYSFVTYYNIQNLLKILTQYLRSSLHICNKHFNEISNNIRFIIFVFPRSITRPSRRILGRDSGLENPCLIYFILFSFEQKFRTKVWLTLYIYSISFNFLP
jgi:hypothetical protein